LGFGNSGFRNTEKYWGRGTKQNFSDGSDSLANYKFQYLQFYHLPSAESVAFKAFLTSFSDNYQSEWNSESVYGRMDPIATFKRTGRTIDASFTIPAAGFQEGVENMMRMTALTQFLYPSYEGSPRTIKGAPFMKVQFMNWIQDSQVGPGGDPKDSGLLGYINGFSFTPNLDAGVFQSGLDIIPKEMSVSFQLTVIHEAPLGWASYGDETTFGDGYDEFPYGFPTGKSLAFDSQTMTKTQQEKNEALTEANVSQLLTL